MAKKEIQKTGQIQIFENEEFGKVRVVEIEGEPWFVGKDVSANLGYSNINKAIQKHVDYEDKKILDFKGFSHLGNSLWGENDYSNKVVINESGVYSLVFSSKLDSAKRFKHWVTAEVIPSIRKHGIYGTPVTIEKMIEDPDFAISLLTELKNERAKNKELQNTVAIQTQQIAEMQPKVSYYDIVLNCKDLMAITEIAKDYGWSAQAMNDYLHEKGVQYKLSDGMWILYKKYAQYGYTSSKTHKYIDKKGNNRVKLHTYWTQKGRLFIYDLLKSDGVLPMIEQENN